MPTVPRAGSTGRTWVSSARSGASSTAGGPRSRFTAATSTSCSRRERTRSSTATTTQARGSPSVRDVARTAFPARGGIDDKPDPRIPPAEVSDTARAGSQHDALPAVSDTSAGYVELHAHSAYSFLDGASLPEELAARAAELGYDVLA